MRHMLFAVVCAVAAAGPAAAQVAPVFTDSTAFERPADVPSPRGAMIRSFLVPGWGQAATRRYLRGGVFFMIQSGSWFMLAKTLGKLDEARDALALRERAAADSIIAFWEESSDNRIDDPFALEAAVDSVGTVIQKRELSESRDQQREDWVAQVIFWTLASAVDAYVSAQLVEFPGEMAAEPGVSGGVSLHYTLPLGGRR